MYYEYILRKLRDRFQVGRAGPLPPLPTLLPTATPKGGGSAGSVQGDCQGSRCQCHGSERIKHKITAITGLSVGSEHKDQANWPGSRHDSPDIARQPVPLLERPPHKPYRQSILPTTQRGILSTDKDRRKRLKGELAELRRELRELEASLPRHSVKPSQLIRIEELEDAIAEKEAALSGLG
jgi:hypothetical protein